MASSELDFVAVATLQIPPDPGVLKAIGLNHALESAIADIVDNSIDAGAARVLIRFVLRGGLVKQIVVIDDGHGMDQDDIDAAFQLGRQKNEGAGKLGHFGMGLKSASFSQASVLTVLSRKSSCPAQGRRMAREGRAVGFECQVLAENQVGRALEDHLAELETPTGTVVLWDELRNFPASKDPSVTHSFVNKKQNHLRHHLGLTLHRLLEQDRISIVIDAFDADLEDSGLAFEVEPIDPFGYPRSGSGDYPKTLVARLSTKSVPLNCHIWPGGSDSRFFKLSGAQVEQYQGFFFYRNGRLLSPGGWGGVTQESKSRKLARVAVDIEDHLDAFRMSMEKTGVRLGADLVRAIELAKAKDGTTFQDYLKAAEKTFQESNRRVRRRQPIVPPGSGIPRRIKKAIQGQVDFIEGEPSIEIRWTRLPNTDFLQVDRSERILWLNTKYRKAILKGTRGGMNDAPLIKTLLFLLLEDIFRGASLGPKDKDNLSMWLGILNAAAEEEIREFSG